MPHYLSHHYLKHPVVSNMQTVELARALLSDIKKHDTVNLPGQRFVSYCGSRILTSHCSCYQLSNVRSGEDAVASYHVYPSLTRMAAPGAR